MNQVRVGSLLALMLVVGCSDLAGPPPPPPAAPAQAERGGRNNDIGEFDPDAGKEIVEPDVTITNPITGALEAYQPLKQKIAGMGIDYAIRLFQATEGRYPRDHDEFMSRIIAENNLRLPSLPTGLRYEYDVANHKLVVVREDNGQAVD